MGRVFFDTNAVLYTEGLQDGLVLGGLRVGNPFAG